MKVIMSKDLILGSKHSLGIQYYRYMNASRLGLYILEKKLQLINRCPEILLV